MIFPPKTQTRERVLDFIHPQPSSSYIAIINPIDKLTQMAEEKTALANRVAELERIVAELEKRICVVEEEEEEDEEDDEEVICATCNSGPFQCDGVNWSCECIYRGYADNW